jgi:Uma2 family endonuclease
MAALAEPTHVVALTTAVSDHVWTLDDLDRMPEGYRYEILEGVLYMAALPAWPHGGIAANLQSILDPWVRSRKLGRVPGAQTGIYYGERNYIDPDLIYLRPEHIPGRGERPTTAALAVEVISPTNLRAPREDREALFRRVGVEEIWYVDYEARSLEVRRGSGDGYATTVVFRNEDVVTSELFPGLQFALTAVWEDLGK